LFVDTNQFTEVISVKDIFSVWRLNRTRVRLCTFCLLYS